VARKNSKALKNNLGVEGSGVQGLIAKDEKVAKDWKTGDNKTNRYL